MMKRIAIRLLILAFLAALIPSLYAQFETAEVLGTVRDPSGAAIPGATVILTNPDTGIRSTTVADEAGNYDFFSVKVGRYNVDVDAVGFAHASIGGITANVNARQRVDVAMQLGAVAQVVEVTDGISVIETDSTEHGQVIAPTAIVELPLNGRNYSDLALLSTNTIKSPISISFSPSGTPREGAFNVNGMRSTYNNFLLDGMDNNAYGPSNQGYSAQVVQPSPDALAEFKVITSN
ncbi:MAG TPA: carboxypeptidase-like regulatory domain-containing protein, partial [Terriglobia bacterium]|nr:carboxypeptidase-like regulatory domain-containing protein [Terriglobia bacterium]